MTNGLFSSRGKDARSGLRKEAQAVEDQIAELREEIAALAGTLASDARKAGRKAGAAAESLKERAEDDLKDLIASGEDILAALQDRYRRSGKEIRESVHDHPLAALGLAAAAGFIVAALMRR